MPPRPRVLITAGPTREHLDDVRFLTNASTGRLGVELARAAKRRGARVTLLLGPAEVEPPAGVETVRVTSTADLLAAARKAAPEADLVLFAAAPSDFRPARRARGKPPREAGERTLALVPTPDVAATLGRGKGRRVHVGFALEVRGGERRARAKLARKRFDAIVLNGPENVGAGGGEASWIAPGCAAEPLSTRSKAILARQVVSRAFALLAARGPTAPRAGARAGRRPGSGRA
jgi:phosphopantothenoylcysteine decarboxylase/phosphopantothenate--cysteine ligase